MNDEYVSAYAIAKICGYNGSFNDFKIKYDQYCEEINEEISEEEPTLAKYLHLLILSVGTARSKIFC